MVCLELIIAKKLLSTHSFHRALSRSHLALVFSKVKIMDQFQFSPDIIFQLVVIKWLFLILKLIFEIKSLNIIVFQCFFNNFVFYILKIIKQQTRNRYKF